MSVRTFRELLPSYSRIIGLCGSIASGKSHAREHLASLGAVTIDADKLGHRAYEKGSPCFGQLVTAFSSDILSPDGEIDRRALGAKVFGVPANLVRLNGIVWPAVEALVIEELRRAAEDSASSSLSATHPLVGVVEAALLIEAKWDTRFDETWVTHVPFEVALERLKERNGLTDEEARRRLASQMPIEERVRHATVIIDTSGAKEVTKSALNEEWARLLARIEAKP